jgi:N12 class adenine-specific DNA methylase
MSSLYEILNQGGAEDQMTDKKKAGFREKLESLIGRSLKGTVLPIESLGFDYLCFDEAHALKKVFTSVKGEVD